MDRSLFPDGVIVEEGDLKHAETTKAYHIQRRLMDTAQSGRVQGLAVTTGVTTTFNIGVGRGYTPRGDLIEISASAPTNVSLTGSEFLLGDYTNGAENLICLHYNEVRELPGSHETAGVSLPRRARGVYDVVVLTPARYDLLPETSDLALNVAVSDANYSRLSKDTLLILAVATATGAGNALTIATPRALPADATVSLTGFGYIGGNFTPTTGVLSSPSSFVPPAVVGGTSLGMSIPGINLVSVQPVASGAIPPYGVGFIQVFVSGSTKSVAWREPSGSGNLGPAITLNSALASQIVTINGRVSNHLSTLTVEVVHSLLPSTNGTYNQYVVVEPLYAETAQVFSSRDEAHRDLRGSYAQTETNPHGIGFKDLAQSLAIIDQPLVLGSNRLSTEAQALVPRITTSGSTATNVDRTLLWLMDKADSSVGNISIRLYKTRFGALEITSNAAWSGTQWLADSTSTVASLWTFGYGAFEVAITDGNATSVISGFNSVYRVNNNTINSSLGATVSPLTSLGSGQYLSDLLVYTWPENLATALSRSRPRASVYVHDTEPTLVGSTQTSIVALSGNPPAYVSPNARLYYENGSAILALNRVYNNGSWQNDTNAYSSVWMTFSPTSSPPEWRVNYTTAANPNTVLTLISGNLSTGVVTFPSSVIFGSTSSAATSARTVFPTSFGSAGGWQRRLLEQVSTSGTGATGSILRYVSTNATSTYSEEAINCSWNGSQWTLIDSSFQAMLIRKGLAGTTHLFQNTPSGSWDDTGWQSTRLNLASSMPASQVNLVANTVYPTNIPKAWATLVKNGATTNPFQIGASFNLYANAGDLDSGSRELVLRFHRPMSPSAGYVVLAQDNTNRSVYVDTNNDAHQLVKIAAVGKTPSSFRLHAYAPQTANGDNEADWMYFNDVQTWPVGSTIDIVVFGESDSTNGPAL